jgi:hypothetical protein
MLLEVIVSPHFLLAPPVFLNIIPRCLTPHSITMRTPVLTTTSTHPSLFSPATSGASGKIVVRRSSSRVQSPITPYSSFLNPRQTLFVSPAGSTVVLRHSLPLFLNVDLGRSHRSPINHYSTSPLHCTHLLARHGYCVHMRPPSVCIASVQCFGRRQGGR